MTTKGSQSKKVFISYSRDSRPHLERVAELSDRLRKGGIEAMIDQYDPSPEDGWPIWMEKRIRESDFVLVVCTETYSRKIEDRDVGKGVVWESTLSYQEIYDARTNRKFIPVVFESADRTHVPKPLRPYTIFDVGAEESYEELYHHLTGQPHLVKPPLGEVRSMPARNECLKDEASAGSNPPEADTPGVLERAKGIIPFHAMYTGGDPDDKGESAWGFQCVGQNIGGGELVGEPTFNVRLEELFRGGLAEGDRFLIRFFNVPEGVRLGLKNAVKGLPASSLTEVRRVDGADECGAGGNRTTTEDGVWEVPVAGRFRYVVYEVEHATHLALSRIDVPIIAGWSGGAGPQYGTMQAATVQCPISSEHPIPAGTYVDTGGNPKNVLTIVACTTTLLFPYVTARAGCDTSIVISNTSEDWFGTEPRDGPCIVHYHGSMSDDSPLPPDQTSAVVMSGEQLTFSVANGNPAKGIDPAPGFQGYIHVVCEFQPAHGMAIVTDNDGGIPNNSYTYMAIVQHKDPDPH